MNKMDFFGHMNNEKFMDLWKDEFLEIFFPTCCGTDWMGGQPLEASG